MKQEPEPIQKLYSAVGGPVALARLLNISYQAVNKWSKNEIPLERVLELEEVTGVPRHEIRPDFYSK